MELLQAAFFHSILNSTSRIVLLQVSFNPVILQLKKISGVLCFLPVFLEAPPPCPPHPATTNLSPSYLHPEFTSCFLDSKVFSPFSLPPSPWCSFPLISSVRAVPLICQDFSFSLTHLLTLIQICVNQNPIAMASSTRTSSVMENKI